MRTPRILAAFFLLGFSSQNALGAEWTYDVHGAAELDSVGYADSLAPTNRSLETGNMRLPTTVKYGRSFKIKLNPVLQADPLNNSISERYWADLPEGYLQFQTGSWVLQAGFNTFSWGVTDGFNPLDIVSAARYQDPLKPEKLGAPSVSLKKDFGKIGFEAIYIPQQRKSILPGINSRWLPRQVFTTASVGSGSQSATVLLPSNLNYYYSPDQERSRALENNYGLRMQAPSVLSGLDASLEYFEGAASTPAVDVGATGNLIQFLPYVVQADSFVTLTPVYYRQRVYGGTLVYANFGMIFRFEAAFNRVISKGVDLPGSAEAFVLGIERPFPLGPDALTLLVQATYSQHSDPIGNSTTSLSRIFDRAGILGARYTFSEKWSAMASGIYDTESHDEMAHLETAYSLTDAWKLGLAGDAFWGQQSTPLGVYNKNDRVILSMRTAF